jgi:uncharacterized protein YjbJ (UPF0337 family)
MGGKTDEVKGRIKEAAGAVTDNDKRRAEGQTYEAVGKVEQVAEKVVDGSSKSRTNCETEACRSGRTGRGSRCEGMAGTGLA